MLQNVSVEIRCSKKPNPSSRNKSKPTVELEKWEPDPFHVQLLLKLWTAVLAASCRWITQEQTKFSKYTRRCNQEQKKTTTLFLLKLKLDNKKMHIHSTNILTWQIKRLSPPMHFHQRSSSSVLLSDWQKTETKCFSIKSWPVQTFQTCWHGLPSFLTAQS